MQNEGAAPAAEEVAGIREWLPAALVLGFLGYVIVGVFWMDAHGTGPQSTLDANSVIGFLAAVFLWPLDLVGLI